MVAVTAPRVHVRVRVRGRVLEPRQVGILELGVLLGGIDHLHRFALQLAVALKNQVIQRRHRNRRRFLIQQRANGFHIPQLRELCGLFYPSTEEYRAMTKSPSPLRVIWHNIINREQAH